MAKQSVKKPCTVLKESFLDEYGLTPARVAKDIGFSQSAIQQIVSGKTRITLNAAVRLAKYFGNTFQYWLDLQTQYDIAELQKDTAFMESVKKIVKAKKQVPAKKAGLKKAVTKTAAPGKPRAKKQPKAKK